MTVFFTSDNHFGHENIITYCDRPFTSAEKMNAVMIELWNSVVGKKDTVYHLGDFAYKSSDGAAEVLKKLNGNIILILGNHDLSPHGTQGYGIDLSLFSATYDKLSLAIDGQELLMTHRPQATWPVGTWHLHGHSHGKAKSLPGRLDVGVDTHDFLPWTWPQIQEYFQPSLPGVF